MMPICQNYPNRGTINSDGKEHAQLPIEGNSGVNDVGTGVNLTVSARSGVRVVGRSQAYALAVLRYLSLRNFFKSMTTHPQLLCVPVEFRFGIAGTSLCKLPPYPSRGVRR